ncbi:hypothetical protein HJG60_008692 [Phyllostomus discolor]|uniref:Uncharacterized protein n=1 Tax=Phyllostomus discolor TaxID=89673 RepID=A0A834DI83_9CHIR|nr:hypothetical protein HJG60_008692 [Phyllostomus discolor]
MCFLQQYGLKNEAGVPEWSVGRPGQPLAPKAELEEGSVLHRSCVCAPDPRSWSPVENSPILLYSVLGRPLTPSLHYGREGEGAVWRGQWSLRTSRNEPQVHVSMAPLLSSPWWHPRGPTDSPGPYFLPEEAVRVDARADLSKGWPLAKAGPARKHVHILGTRSSGGDMSFGTERAPPSLVPRNAQGELRGEKAPGSFLLRCPS